MKALIWIKGPERPAPRSVGAHRRFWRIPFRIGALMYRVQSAGGHIDDLSARLALAELESLTSVGIDASVLDDEGRAVTEHTLRVIVALGNFGIGGRI